MNAAELIRALQTCDPTAPMTTPDKGLVTAEMVRVAIIGSWDEIRFKMDEDAIAAKISAALRPVIEVEIARARIEGAQAALSMCQGIRIERLENEWPTIEDVLAELSRKARQ